MSKVNYVMVNVLITTVLIAGEYSGENEGELCDTEEPGVVGTCKFDYLCDYTDRLINEEFRLPNICSANVTHRLVCCPNNNYQTGILGRTFMDSQNGRLSTGDIECRYTGELPLVCCKRAKVETTVQVETRFSAVCERTDPRMVEACKACSRYSSQRVGLVCPQETSIKIADGETAEIQEFPHMVVLGCRNRGKKTAEDADIVWVAGGTLISHTYVLTAAHALYSNDYGNIEFALLGSTNNADIKNGILTNIVSTERYKLYSSASHYHDLALVELDTTIPITKFTRPACLPVPGVMPEVVPSAMKVAGWGRVGQRLNASRVLKMGDMFVQPSRDCWRSLETTRQRWNSSISICAKSETADTCYGDSGGPLMVPLQKNSRLCGFLVMGVVSYGSVCGKNSPGAYVNLAFRDYLEWIVRTVWKK